MLNIDETILVNQLAQKIRDLADSEEWFAGQSVDDKRRILRGMNFLALQASPRPEDSEVAVAESHLRPTLNPCVMILKPNLKMQLAKLADLPEPELWRTFQLVIALLRIADARRRKEKPLDLVNHWWHRDLADPKIVEDIRRTYIYGRVTGSG